MLTTTKPDSFMFNNNIYTCRWTRTLLPDGQWREISFSFNRRHGRSRWSTEHYVRVGKELWILQRRTPSPPQYHYDATCGTFYDVPVKLLRPQSCIRGASMNRYGAVAVDPIFCYFWNSTDDLLSEDKPDFCVVHPSTRSAALPPSVSP